MSEIKPCPFCGGVSQNISPPTCTRQSKYDPSDRAFPVVRCLDCYAEVWGSDWDHSANTAVEKWNTRAESAELQRLTAALEAARGDAERLDWLESQDTEGVHVEKMHRGSLSGRDLEVIATVFTACPEREYKAHTIREAIDAARHAREQEKGK